MNYTPEVLERMQQILKDNMEADPRLQIISNLLTRLELDMITKDFC
jgi:hypothetical protein